MGYGLGKLAGQIAGICIFGFAALSRIWRNDSPPPSIRPGRQAPVTDVWPQFKPQLSPQLKPPPWVDPSVEPSPSRPSGNRARDLAIRWTQQIHPPEECEIEYADRHGEFSERRILLTKIGEFNGLTYVGVIHMGSFKTLRADRILRVSPVEGKTPMRQFPALHGRSTQLPPWPTPNAVFRVPTLTGNRHWTVNLNTYNCTCPEKRIRQSAGHKPGTLGWVCPHMARAIRENLPLVSDWDPFILAFLSDEKKVSVNGLL